MIIKLILKLLLWLIFLFIGIMFIYWFSDVYNNYLSYLAIWDDQTITTYNTPDSFLKYFPIGPFVITIGILSLLYSIIFIIYEIMKKFNVKVVIRKKSSDQKQIK